MSAKNKSFVYLIKAGCDPRAPIKIGVAGDVHKRLKQLQTGNPKELILVMHFQCNDRSHAFALEKSIHEILDGQRLCGEWFKVTRSRLMKVINNLGNEREIESLTKEVCLFQKYGLDISEQSKQSKIIKSRDIEIADVQRALADAKKVRGAYINKLLELGVSYQEIKELKNGAKA